MAKQTLTQRRANLSANCASEYRAVKYAREMLQASKQRFPLQSEYNCPIALYDAVQRYSALENFYVRQFHEDERKEKLRREQAKPEIKEEWQNKYN